MGNANGMHDMDGMESVGNENGMHDVDGVGIAGSANGAAAMGAANTAGRSLTRRQFVAGAALLGGSLALAGCAAGRPATEGGAGEGEKAGGADFEESADIVVVGSGLAGLSCCVAAARNGADVLLIDKAPFLTSTFLTSKGNVSIAQVKENERDWIFEPETPETMDEFIARYRTMTEIGKVDAPYPAYDRVRRMMEESCKTVAWAEELDVDFVQSFTKEQVGTDTVKPDTAADPDREAGAQLADAFAAELDRLGVRTMTSTEATELVEEDGAIVGVRATCKGKTLALRAKAVVLATGGFGASDRYLDELAPTVNALGFQYRGNEMNTGDGMTMASAVGAALYEDGWPIPFVIMPTRTLTREDSAFAKLCDNGMDGAGTSSRLLVDATGERFANEGGPVTALTAAMVDRDAGPYYVLYDGSNAEVAALLERGLATGDVKKADTVSDLAEAAGMAKLTAAFEAYGQAVERGVDEAFGKQGDLLLPYGDGPFYLVAFVPSYVATMGGVKTDDDCRAVREDGSAIEGLYAIGEVAHRFMYNRSFVRHCSNSSALTMGRLTGAAISETI